jgi:hypothetical protein
MEKYIITDKNRDIVLFIDVNNSGAICGINYCKDIESPDLKYFMIMNEGLSTWVISRLFAMDLIKYVGSEEQLDCICRAIEDHFNYFEIPALTSFDDEWKFLKEEIIMEKPKNITNAFALALHNAGFSGYGK